MRSTSAWRAESSAAGRAIPWPSQDPGRRPSGRGGALNNLALVAGDRGDYAAAESLSRQALAVSGKALGERHPRRAMQWNNLASALREQGRFDEAALALEEALGIALPALGGDHLLTVAIRVNLARLCLARGEAAKAEPLLRQALEAYKRNHPEKDWRVGSARSLLGAALTGLGRYDEAEPLLLEARATLPEGPGPPGREARANLERPAALSEARARPGKPVIDQEGAPVRESGKGREVRR